MPESLQNGLAFYSMKDGNEKSRRLGCFALCDVTELTNDRLNCLSFNDCYVIENLCKDLQTFLSADLPRVHMKIIEVILTLDHK